VRLGNFCIQAPDFKNPSIFFFKEEIQVKLKRDLGYNNFYEPWLAGININWEGAQRDYKLSGRPDEDFKSSALTLHAALLQATLPTVLSLEAASH
jgi:hypothetical protein